MKFFNYLIAAAMIIGIALSCVADDGTMGTAYPPEGNNDKASGSFTQPTDEVYVISPFESVSISQSSTWQDNRHRAYWSSSLNNVNGFLLFDVSQIPDNSIIVSMILRCYLENAFGSPSSNPVVDIYWSDDDNWTRSTAVSGGMSLNDLLVDNIPFSSYIPQYDFTLNVAAHNWSIDLLDNRICLGFKNDVTYYSYVYFFGAYGSPIGPPPELTITTSTGGPLDVEVTLTPSNPPITIPANGGSFEFNIEVTNNETSASTFSVWTMATLPDGREYGPIIGPIALTLNPGQSADRDRNQAIGSGAPTGTYSYDAYVGVYPDNIWNEDHFDFEKLPLSDGGALVPEWNSSGETFDNLKDEASRVNPGEFALLSACPNPFNPSTTIMFSLENPGNIELAVFDVTGREVARLAEGFYQAGNHEAVFNAVERSSGIYFAVLKTSLGIMTKKLLLIK